MRRAVGSTRGAAGSATPAMVSTTSSWRASLRWGSIWMSLLPGVDLVALDDQGISALAAALEDMATRRADGRRTFGRTASAKLLFALRPATVTAWDDAIARRPGVAGDFGAHLRDARADRESVGRPGGGWFGPADRRAARLDAREDRRRGPLPHLHTRRRVAVRRSPAEARKIGWGRLVHRSPTPPRSGS